MCVVVIESSDRVKGFGEAAGLIAAMWCGELTEFVSIEWGVVAGRSGLTMVGQVRVGLEIARTTMADGCKLRKPCKWQ